MAITKCRIWVPPVSRFTVVPYRKSLDLSRTGHNAVGLPEKGQKMISDTVVRAESDDVLSDHVLGAISGGVHGHHNHHGHHGHHGSPSGTAYGFDDLHLDFLRSGL